MQPHVLPKAEMPLVVVYGLRIKWHGTKCHTENRLPDKMPPNVDLAVDGHIPTYYVLARRFVCVVTYAFHLCVVFGAMHRPEHVSGA